MRPPPMITIRSATTCTSPEQVRGQQHRPAAIGEVAQEPRASSACPRGPGRWPARRGSGPPGRRGARARGPAAGASPASIGARACARPRGRARRARAGRRRGARARRFVWADTASTSRPRRPGCCAEASSRTPTRRAPGVGQVGIGAARARSARPASGRDRPQRTRSVRRLAGAVGTEEAGHRAGPRKRKARRPAGRCARRSVWSALRSRSMPGGSGSRATLRHVRRSMDASTLVGGPRPASCVRLGSMSTAHGALEELRDVIGVLREGPPRPSRRSRRWPRSPPSSTSPGAGMRVRCTLDLTAHPALPAAVGRAAYRIARRGPDQRAQACTGRRGPGHDLGRGEHRARGRGRQPPRRRRGGARAARAPRRGHRPRRAGRARRARGRRARATVPTRRATSSCARPSHGRHDSASWLADRDRRLRM